MTQQIQVRAFRPTDLGDIEALCKLIFEGDIVGDRVITRDFVLAPGFDPANLIIAEVAGHFAGFVLLANGSGHQQNLWLVAFGVKPKIRGNGVGKALAAAAIARTAALNRMRLDIAAIPTRYLVPGLDQQANPAAYGLVTKHFGFIETARVCSMTRQIGDVDLQPFPAAISALLDDEIAELRAFMIEEFDATWWDYLATSLRTKFSDDKSHRAIFVARTGGKIVGVAHLHDNRFGPLAVAAAARGLGYGRLLTKAALSAAQRFGYADVYFMLAELEVVPFYQRLGFTGRRTYTQLAKLI